MRNTVLFGDALASLQQMAAAGVKVQTCVTSPPYYGLRDYGTAAWVGGDPACDHRPAKLKAGRNEARPAFGDSFATHGSQLLAFGKRTTCDKCGAVKTDQQIGLEESTEAYIARLVAVFRAVREVLSDDGTLWVNIGDSYSTKGGPQPPQGGAAQRGRARAADSVCQSARLPAGEVKHKDLLGIPWMLAFALRADGWYLRSDIIWQKPNPMPESVTDRPTKAHEYVFLLSKSPRYFYDVVAAKEPAVGAPSGNKVRKQRPGADVLSVGAQAGSVPWAGGATRNRRSVWTITTRPYKGAHFATFPPDLVRPCIVAATSERGHCPACLARWSRVLTKVTSFESGSGRAGTSADAANASGKHRGGIQGANKNLKLGPVVSASTVAWVPGCKCGLDAVPDVVLDPFFGSGTTGAVALEHGRDFLGCELNPDYKPLQDARLAAAVPAQSSLLKEPHAA